MALIRNDDATRARIQRDPEYARLMRESAIELLEGNDEDRRIALRILRGGFGLDEDEIDELKRNKATA